jgi:Flp pilus assembly protein CpaB
MARKLRSGNASLREAVVAVISVSPTRALRRPFRLDVRALVGILLMLVAIGGSIAVWTTEQDTREVLVMARDLPAGATVQDADVNVTRARLDDPVYAAAFPRSMRSQVVGRQLAEPAHANQMLVRSQISTRPRLGEGQMVFAIPVRSDAAAGGRLRANDNVAVIATNSRGDGAAHVVLPQVTVYEVGRDSGSSLTSSSSSSSSASTGPLAWITLIVTQDQAVQLAQARWSSDLDVALLPAQ